MTDGHHGHHPLPDGMPTGWRVAKSTRRVPRPYRPLAPPRPYRASACLLGPLEADHGPHRLGFQADASKCTEPRNGYRVVPRASLVGNRRELMCRLAARLDSTSESRGQCVTSRPCHHAQALASSSYQAQPARRIAAGRLVELQLALGEHAGRGIPACVTRSPCGPYARLRPWRHRQRTWPAAISARVGT